MSFFARVEEIARPNLYRDSSWFADYRRIRVAAKKDVNDTDFLSAFEDCSLPFEQWSHRAHVRVAYMYATQHELCSATDRMSRGIKAYNRATDTPETLDRGYHETITKAFMRLVFAAVVQSGPHGSSEEFCDRHPELLSKHSLLHFLLSRANQDCRSKS